MRIKIIDHPQTFPSSSLSLGNPTGLPPLHLVCSRFLDPPVLTFNLFWHRHPSLSIPPSSCLIRYNKVKKYYTNKTNKKNVGTQDQSVLSLHDASVRHGIDTLLEHQVGSEHGTESHLSPGPSLLELKYIEYHTQISRGVSHHGYLSHSATTDPSCKLHYFDRRGWVRGSSKRTTDRV
jgi:hypothetical protein